LPKTLKWRQVVRLLNDSPADTPAVARAALQASAVRLRELADDRSLTECFWLLTRIASASRGTDFDVALSRLGLESEGADSAVAFISRINDRARAELALHPESGPFSELASLALRRALTETVGQEGRSLFGSSLDDLQQAFRRHATEKQFGILAHGFFGDFFARTLRFFVEKELSNQVGPGHGLESLRASQDFAASLDLYARQSASIMEDFAAGWFSKHHWDAKGEISREEARGFVAVALRKLRMELVRAEA